MKTSPVTRIAKKPYEIDYGKYSSSDAPVRSRILLIMPRLVNKVGEGYQFPLGIAYISSSLKKAGFQVTTVNLNHTEENSRDILERLIRQNDIGIVATGGISIQFNSIQEIAKQAKSIDSSIITIIGGGLITAEPKVAMEALEYADYGVIGEGEETICELIYSLEKKQDLSAVDGIIFKSGGALTQTRPRAEIMNLDALPWPDYDGFDLDKYLELPPPDVNNLGEERLAFILGSRSCPYSCTFCFHTIGKKYRKRSMQSISDEIEYLVAKYNVKFLFMADELFGVDNTRVREFCELMRRLNLPWRGSFRVDEIDRDIVEMLKKGKCAIIGLGLESADNRILKSMRKKITIEQIENALKIIYEANIPFSGNFIFGDIEETVETATNTFNWWLAHPEYNINMWMVISYPGSYLYQYACENNLIKDRVDYLKKGCPAVNVSRLNREELNWLIRNILEMPAKKASNVIDTQLIHTDRATNRMTVSGKCAKCGAANIWEGIKPFISVSIPCSKCAQKHNTPTPLPIETSIIHAIRELLEKRNKIGIWGITFHSTSILGNHAIFSDPDIVLIDNSSYKQMMTINEKPVHDPSVINDKNLTVIVVFYPNSFQQVEAMIHSTYPTVRHIIDVCDLIHAPG